VRFAFRSPETDNFWSQLILASTSYAERTAFSAASAPFAADSADTTTTRPQYVLMTGGRVGGLRTTVAARYRRFDSEDFVSPSVRAEWGAGALLVSGSFERTAEDSLTRADAGARYTVGSRLALAGQLSRRGSFSDSAPDAQQFVRADASVRLGSWWFSGGYIQRDSLGMPALRMFGDSARGAIADKATGQVYTAAGPLYRALRGEASTVRWDAPGALRPQNVIRARVGLETDWRARFPRGDFTIRAWIMVEERDGMLFPSDTGLVPLPPARPFSSLLEIRIRSATISWQFRNFLGAEYQTVPGFAMPSRINMYGVRWNFRN
jgi:hypothetical protein